MSIESALYDHLTGSTPLSALVSTRIYPGTAPQGVTQPYITFNVVSGDNDRHAQGGGELVNTSVQIDVWAATAVSRADVKEALRNRLHGFAGAMGTESLSIRSARLDGPTDSFEEPINGSEEGIFRGRVEVQIWHAETEPTGL